MGISLIMSHLDNIVKCFASAIIIYVTTLSSYLIFGESVDLFFVLGLSIVTVALYMYFGSHNEVLKLHQASVPMTNGSDDSEKSYRFCGRSSGQWVRLALKTLGLALVCMVVLGS